jgi:hypothetical protein
MSALLAVCGTRALHIMSDAAATQASDGIVGALRCKQIVLPNGTLLASYTFNEPLVRFAELASQCADLDEVLASMRDLWEQARAVLGPCKDKRCGVLLAGWSAKAGRLRMDVIVTEGGYRYLWADVSAFGCGPAQPMPDFLHAFNERFAAEPDAFSPRRDGLPIMERLRRESPRDYDSGRHSVVGGYVQISTLTRDYFRAGILRHWPDEVGRNIRPDGDASADTPWDDIFRRREASMRMELTRFFPETTWVRPTTKAA